MKLAADSAEREYGRARRAIEEALEAGLDPLVLFALRRRFIRAWARRRAAA